MGNQNDSLAVSSYLSLCCYCDIVSDASQEGKDGKALLRLTAIHLSMTYTAHDLVLACTSIPITSSSNPHQCHSTHTRFHCYSNTPNWACLKTSVLFLPLSGKHLSNIFSRFFSISSLIKRHPPEKAFPSHSF